METHALFIKDEGIWIVDTSIPAHWRKLNKQGWKAILINECSDGTVQSVIFKAPKNAISFRRGGDFHCENLEFKLALSEERREELSKRMKDLNQAE